MAKQLDDGVSTTSGFGGLGRGFDVTGRYSADSYRRQLFDLQGGSNVQSSVIGRSRQTSWAMASRQELTQKLETEAGISGAYSGFSGEFSAAYSQTAHNDFSRWFFRVFFRYESTRNSLLNVRPNYLLASVTSDPDFQAIPSSYDDSKLPLFAAFFDKFGTYFVNAVSMGGTLDYWSSIERSVMSDEVQASAEASATYLALFSANASADWSKVNKTWTSEAYGSLDITSGPGSKRFTLSNPPRRGDNYQADFAAWIASLDNSPAPVGFQLAPISSIFSGSKAAAVQEALEVYTGSRLNLEATAGPYYPRANPYPYAELKNQPIKTPPTAYGGVQYILIDRATATVTKAGTYPLMTAWNSAPGLPQNLDALYSNVLKPVEGDPSTIVCLNFYGIDTAKLQPTRDLVTFLKSIGADEGLARWTTVTTSGALNNHQQWLIVGHAGLNPGEALSSPTGAVRPFSAGYLDTRLGVNLVPKFSGGHLSFELR